MSEFLEQALAKLQELSEPEQDAIASLILEEISDEQRWDEAFAGRRTSSRGSRRACVRTSGPGESKTWERTNCELARNGRVYRPLCGTA